MDDTTLWNKLKSGDKRALREIYEANAAYLIRYGKKFSQNQATIEDTLQNLFLYIWEKKDGLSPTDSIRRYLLVAFRRRLIRELQKHDQQFDEKGAHFDASISIEDQWIQNQEDEQKRSLLKKAFDQLSPRQKEAIYLRFYQQLPYEDIGKVMNLNNQSARNLVSGGIKALRKKLVPILLIFIFF